MVVIGERTRTQAPPPHIVHAALCAVDADPPRRWVLLEWDETCPTVTRQQPPTSVTWSSPWPKRPDAEIEFTVEPAGDGTALTWTLCVAEPVPDEAYVGHLRKRMNQLINRDLRASFGQ